jgi:hypothetical protein
MQSSQGTTRLSLSTVVGHFTGHVLIGTIGFVMLAIPAIALSLMANYLAEMAIAPIVTKIFIGLHYFLLIIDSIVFIAYMVVSLYYAAVELIALMKAERQ